MFGIRDFTPRPMLVTHPKNKALLEGACESDDILPQQIDLLRGMPVEFDPYVAPRFVEEIWHPPTGDRFTEYGPEDAVWMRPLGLGSIERVDRGPAFWIVTPPGGMFTFPKWRPLLVTMLG